MLVQYPKDMISAGVKFEVKIAEILEIESVQRSIPWNTIEVCNKDRGAIGSSFWRISNPILNRGSGYDC